MFILSRTLLNSYYFHLVSVAVTARTKSVIEPPMRVACQSLLARLLVTNITCNTHKLYTFFSIR